MPYDRTRTNEGRTPNGVIFDTSIKGIAWGAISNQAATSERVRRRKEEQRRNFEQRRADRRRAWEERKANRGNPDTGAGEQNSPEDQRVAYLQFVIADYQNGSDYEEPEDPSTQSGSQGVLTLGIGSSIKTKPTIGNTVFGKFGGVNGTNSNVGDDWGSFGAFGGAFG